MRGEETARMSYPARTRAQRVKAAANGDSARHDEASGRRGDGTGHAGETFGSGSSAFRVCASCPALIRFHALQFFFHTTVGDAAQALHRVHDWKQHCDAPGLAVCTLCMPAEDMCRCCAENPTAAQELSFGRACGLCRFRQFQVVIRQGGSQEG